MRSNTSPSSIATSRRLRLIARISARVALTRR
jgi:hypothetical protein